MLRDHLLEFRAHAWQGSLAGGNLADELPADVWGLASFGEPGVDRVLEILDVEFITIMRQAGALNVAQITRDNVSRT